MAEEINLPTQPTNSPVSPMDPTPKNSLTIPIILILAVFSMGISGYLFWQNQNLQKQLTAIQTPNPSPLTTTPSPIVSPSPSEESPNPTAGWKTYSSPNNYTVRYPQDWSIETSPETDWFAESGVPKFSVIKNNYKIIFSFPTGFGPGICIFSDHPDFTNDFSDSPILAGSKCPGEFVEIKAGQITFRRKSLPTTPPKEGYPQEWAIYSKDNNGNFVTVPPISYDVPVNFDQAVIKLMDQILSTFKFTE